MTDATIWTGWLKRGLEPGSVYGELVDQWQWRVVITGTFNEQTREYALRGVLGAPPSGLRVAAIDEPEAAE